MASVNEFTALLCHVLVNLPYWVLVDFPSCISDKQEFLSY